MRALPLLLGLLLPSLALAQRGTGYRADETRVSTRPAWTKGSQAELLSFDRVGHDSWGDELPVAATLHCVAAANGALSCTGATPTTAGTPTTVASPYRPDGFSAADPQAVRYNGSTDYHHFGDVLDYAGSRTIAIAFRPAAVASNKRIYSKGGVSADVFIVRVDNNGALGTYWFKAGGTYTYVPCGALTANAWTVVALAYEFVADGTSRLRCNLNGTAIAEATNLVGPIRDTAGTLKIGSYDGSQEMFTGDVAVVTEWQGYAASAAQLDALVRSQQASRGLTVTRAAPESEIVGSSLFQVASNTLGVVSGGAQIYGSAQHLALYSEALDNEAWYVVGTITRDGAGFPNTGPDPKGGTTADKLDNTGDSTGCVYQNITVSSSVGPFTASAWVASVTGSGPQTVRAQCPAVAAASCTCAVSSGSCTATTAVEPAVCAAYTTVGTTPVRLEARVTCDTAVTAPIIALSPGQYGTAGGVGYYWGADFTVTPTVYPYVATSGSPVTQPAATAYAARAIHDGRRFCFGARAVLEPTGQGILLRSYPTAPGTNDVTLYLSAGSVYFDVWDGAPALKRLLYTPDPVFASAVEHTIKGCAADGKLTLLVDDASVGALSGAGSGIPTLGGNLYIGSRADGNFQFNGRVSRTCQSNSSNPQECAL